MSQLKVCLQLFNQAMPDNVFGSKIPNNPPYYTIVSRLNYNADVFKCKSTCISIDELLKISYNNQSWEEVVDQRAQELLHTNKRIYLMWSGGIDSTCALVSILKNWKTADLDRLVVLCNYYSIQEYKEFFIKYVSKLNYKIVDSYLEQYCKDGLLVTGEQADNLYGINSKWFIKNNLILDKNWKDAVINFWKMQTGSLEKSQKLFDKFEPIVNEYPGEIEYGQQFFWWFYFTQQWQLLHYRLLSVDGAFLNPGKYYSSVSHFYDTNDFQLWSIFNQDKRTINNIQSHKWPAKKYIIDFTNDQSFNNKIKKYSLQHILKFNKFHWGIDQDFNFLNFEH
jgi:hypothetical protein